MKKPNSIEAREANRQAVTLTLGATCKAACEAIRSLFQVPVKVTIVIRVPGLTRGDTLFGDDDPDEVIKAVERVVKFRQGG